MRRVLYFVSTGICLVGLAMVSARPAYGYADPGSGLLAVQVLGATLSAIAFYFRYQIRRLFGRTKKPVANAHLLSITAPESEPDLDSPDAVEVFAMNHSGNHESR